MLRCAEARELELRACFGVSIKIAAMIAWAVGVPSVLAADSAPVIGLEDVREDPANMPRRAAKGDIDSVCGGRLTASHLRIS